MTQNKPSARKSKSEPEKRAKKVPKRISETYLHNSGLYYLERFAASSAHFRSVMMRKVKKSCLAHPDQDYERCAALVDQLVDKFIRAGLLNDELYARGMVSSLRRRGKSKNAIIAKTRAKQVEPALALQELETIDTETHVNEYAAELEAATTHARKKRLGPYRGHKEADLKKELANMARAGFSYDTARRVLMAEDEEFDAP